MQQTLSIDVKAAVKLPPGEDINDWLSVSIVDFFHQLDFIFEPVSELCTNESCPEMSAGPAYKYAWVDDVEYKKPTILPAHDYIEKVFLSTEEQINNESIFPSDPSVSYPKDFKNTCQIIMRRLFRVYAHLYCHHLEDVKNLGLFQNLNSSFRHFVYFAKEFKLIPDDQYAPLQSLIDQL